jgi:ABC-type lipoprotein export system ATPase subunit
MSSSTPHADRSDSTSSIQHDASPLISCSHVSKSYDEGRIQALADISLSVDHGEFVAIRGPSGCGKSTLMQLIGYLEAPDAGKLLWNGVPYSALDPDLFRSRNVGFVFQLHNLLPTLTARQNVEVPMFESWRSRAQRRERAHELLDAVGVANRAASLPRELSGGERQRVAIARALANDPALLLADEPTGNLDSAAGELVMHLIEQTRSERQLTVLLVTHDERVAARAQREVNMLDGRLIIPTGG